MQSTRPVGIRIAGWAALVLTVLATGVAVLGGVVFARSLSGEHVSLPDGPHQVSLPPDRTYGIYVNDVDNSGYSEDCSIQDSDGRPVPLRTGGLFATSSDTLMLDAVFPTRSGDLVVACSVPGEEVTLRPVPNIIALVVDIAVSVVLWLVAAGLLIVWLLRRSPRAPAYAPGS